MNRIWNSAYGDNSNIKRISNTINFKIGQRVYGRIVKTLDVNQAIIKLLNGMELHAEIKEGLNEFKHGVLQFQVEGMKDDRLQLKLLEREKNTSNTFNNELMKFIDNEGLNKEDNKLLQGMLKYDLSLSKDNIGKVKSLLEFNEKIKNNPNEIDNFIEKYIASKATNSDSTIKDSITKELKIFFNSFKSLTADDILLFLENNIEFTEENINSYKSLFKENNNINNILKVIDENLDSIENDIENISFKTIQNGSIEESKVNVNLNSNKIDLNNENINVKEIYNNSDILEKDFKNLGEIFKESSLILDKKEIITVFNIIKKFPLDKLDQDTLKNTLGNVLKREISLSEEGFKKLLKSVKELINKIDIKNDNFNEVKNSINNKAEEAKEIIQKLLVSLSDDDKDLSQIVNIIKNNINDIKMFNKFSDEYYYFNFPVNFNKNEYPCKLIIKDNRKEGKKLDSKNIKLALNVNTKHFNDVDAFVKVINKSMDIEISCDEKYIKVFEVSKENLKNTLESIGFLARISVSKKKYDLDLTACRDFFGENNVAGVDIKV